MFTRKLKLKGCSGLVKTDFIHKFGYVRPRFFFCWQRQPTPDDVTLTVAHVTRHISKINVARKIIWSSKRVETTWPRCARVEIAFVCSLQVMQFAPRISTNILYIYMCIYWTDTRLPLCRGAFTRNSSKKTILAEIFRAMRLMPIFNGLKQKFVALWTSKFKQL